MITRREAREQAFALIFEMAFQNLPIQDLIDNAVDSRDLEVDEYAVKVAKAVQMNCAQIDSMISEHSKKWKIERLSKVALSILRLAIAEMSFVKEVPEGAVINEAVELAKTFGGEDDPSYINGVLGGFSRSALSSQSE